MLRHGEEVDWKVGHTPAVQYPPPPQRSRQRAASTSQAQAPETLRMVHHATHQTKAEPSPPPPSFETETPRIGSTVFNTTTQSFSRRDSHPTFSYYLRSSSRCLPPSTLAGRANRWHWPSTARRTASAAAAIIIKPPNTASHFPLPPRPSTDLPPRTRTTTPELSRTRASVTAAATGPPHQPRPSYPVFPPEPESESSQPAASSKPSHQRSQSFPHPRSTTATSSNASANGNTNMASTSRADASTSDLPPLSLSILGVEPLDEFIKEIADFVHHMIVTRPEHLGGLVEVEAKVGVLREPRSGARIHVPVLVESVLQPDALDVRFESNMSVTQHRHYNQLLNNLKTSSDSPSHPASPVEYSHLYLIDTSSTPTPQMTLTNGDRRLRGGDKIRVTRDEKTNSVVHPKRSADWRISVNLEVPCTLLQPGLLEFMIDLTQVVSHTSPGAPPQTSHELELEVSRPELLLATAAKRNDLNYSEHERSAFDELIRAFVNNARILVRNSIPFDIPQ
ncbi:CYTH-like domain-containing protein [Coprinopsis sp. MPI-PUGE-AT-0042]|nr:CYTH-like domain-containing protein [Coprinopsis sp. MPI-PUGE-AT-0042]